MICSVTVRPISWRVYSWKRRRREGDFAYLKCVVKPCIEKNGGWMEVLFFFVFFFYSDEELMEVLRIKNSPNLMFLIDYSI